MGKVSITEAGAKALKHIAEGLKLGKMLGTKVTWYRSVWVDYYTYNKVLMTGTSQGMSNDGNPYGRLVWASDGTLHIVPAVLLTEVN